MKYDYSKFIYVNRNTKGIVICPVHGEFWITPANHINSKSGCPLCNKRKTNGYWTLEKCKEEALKYRTKKEWEFKSVSSYSSAKKYGWYYECCKHMIKINKSHNHWNLKNCIKDAKKYKIKNEWKKNSVSAYSIAHKNGWLKDCCKHMVSGNKLRWKK